MLFAAIEEPSAVTVLMSVLTLITTGMATALRILWKRVDREHQECREDRNKLHNLLLSMAPLGCSDRECTDRMPLPIAKVSLSSGGKRDFERRHGDEE